MRALIPRDRGAHPVPRNPDCKTSLTRAPDLPLLSLPSTPPRRRGRSLPPRCWGRATTT